MKTRRLLPLLLLLLLSALLLSACSRKEKEAELSLSVPDEDRFFSVSPDFDAVDERIGVCYASVLPLCGSDGGTFTFTVLAQQENRPAQEDAFFDLWLLTCTPDAALVRQEPIRLPTAMVFMSGVITEDGLILFCRDEDDNVTLWRMERDTGALSKAEEDPGAYGGASKDDTTTYLCRDREGRIYAIGDLAARIYDEQLNLLAFLAFPVRVRQAATGADGRIWVTYTSGTDVWAAPIDVEGGGLGEAHRFTRGTDMAETPVRNLLNAGTAGSDGCAFYYYDAKAVWGVTVAEDGSLAETKKVDFAASSFGAVLNRNETGMRQGIYPFFYFETPEEEGADGRVLLTRDIDGAFEDSHLRIWRRDPDAGTPVRVITLAHASELPPNVKDRIARFNREHRDVRIDVRDYSGFSMAEDPLGGEAQIVFDILNAGFRPDILVSSADSRSTSDRMAAVQLNRRDLFVDLIPYMEADDELNPGNVFGCIRHLFDNGRGGMWGIAPEFAYATVAALPEQVGVTDTDPWTPEEMLDFFDSLPDGAEPSLSQTQMWNPETDLLARGWGTFLENGSGGFGSETFVRFLRFLRSLPADMAERGRRYPDVRVSSNDPAAVYGVMREGKVGIARQNAYDSTATLNCLTLVDFHRAEFVFPGMAADSGSGTVVTAKQGYSVTRYAEDPETCFALIKSFIIKTDFDFDARNALEWKMPALKSIFAREMDIYAETMSGIFDLPTEEEREFLYAFWDAAGYPFLEETPEDVAAIVNEELSAYLAGIGTAEDCAGKIQSRVSLWEAEHQ